MAGRTHVGPPVISEEHQWLGHTVTFTVLSISDRDCCCNPQAQPQCWDEDETVFDCAWKIDRWTGTQWQGDYGTGTGNCVVGSCQTNCGDGGDPPGRYQVRLVVDDTPGDGGGAIGDDPPEESDGVPFDIELAGITNMRADPVKPYEKKADGTLTFYYIWDSTCGLGNPHIDPHLRYASCREYVTFENLPGDPPGKHYMHHGHTLPFDNLVHSPYRGPKSVNGTEGGATDNQLVPDITQPPWAADGCNATQKYEGATHYPDPPDNMNDAAGWQTLLADMTIHRKTEQVPGGAPGKLQYFIEKSGVSHTIPIN